MGNYVSVRPLQLGNSVSADSLGPASAYAGMSAGRSADGCGSGNRTVHIRNKVTQRYVGSANTPVILLGRRGDPPPRSPQMARELGKCGSYSATYGPPIALDLGKRESIVGSARTASVGCGVSWGNGRGESGVRAESSRQFGGPVGWLPGVATVGA